ncbi:MAG: glycerophosphodiester phosphodiesterase [Candidatus Mcinerneyibacterium aminivorans]|uniref:Glycerophosphodiester phosphodiesterase n=1 Tax=Candidatus Mcinerneyibacterium aminivorans TaxID=2703815 RepID=A0A5D0MLN7_9BACT|nr:MAG: glycerophosphodiester phosphodiesterase [Candidatus Mcinerneyibacterium aminivorans]
MKIGLHRAFHRIYGENNLNGLKNIEHEIDFVELDFQLTKDKKLILHHDEYDVDDSIISDTEKNLLKVDSTKGDVDVNSVLDYIMRETDLKINAEIKDSPLLDKKFSVDDYIKRFLKYPKDRIFYSSFNSNFIYSLKRKYPDMETGVVFESSFDLLKFRWDLIDNLHPHWSVVTAKMIETSHRLDKKIITYTVDSKNVFKKLKELKVDGVITNYPDKLL